MTSSSHGYQVFELCYDDSTQQQIYITVNRIQLSKRIDEYFIVIRDVSPSIYMQQLQSRLFFIQKASVGIISSLEDTIDGGHKLSNISIKGLNFQGQNVANSF